MAGLLDDDAAAARERGARRDRRMSDRRARRRRCCRAPARCQVPFDPDDDSAPTGNGARASSPAIPRTSPTSSVEVRDPRALTAAERAALVDRCRRANMAVYASPRHATPTRSCRALLGRQLGPRPARPQLARRRRRHQQRDGRRRGGARRIHPVHEPADPLAHRRLLQPAGAAHPRRWCCTASRSAATGGENALLDHEIAYLLLRDADPGARARADAARRDDDPGARATTTASRGRRETGPVFSVDPDERRAAHALHRAHAQHRVEATIRRSRAAVAALERAAGDARRRIIHRVTLQPGMGIVCNNVLHDRSGFVDDPARAAAPLPRALLRPRRADEASGARRARK